MMRVFIRKKVRIEYKRGMFFIDFRQINTGFRIATAARGRSIGRRRVGDLDTPFLGFV